MEWSVNFDISSILITVVVFTLIIVFFKDFKNILKSIIKRIELGDAIKISSIITIGKSTGKLSKPSQGGLFTDEHIAIVHRSWYRDDKKMYQIHLALFGLDEILDKVEYVAYRLDPAYPNPIKVVSDRSTQFGFYELANGYSLVRAEVKMKGQELPVLLTRFVDMSKKSEPLKESGFVAKNT